MFKVTLIFAFSLLISCTSSIPKDTLDIYEAELNKVTEARIDSVYQHVEKECDSLLTYVVPSKVDSILKNNP